MNPHGFKMLGQFWLLSASFAHADDPVIRLSSLEWPPYAGVAVDQQGASAAVVRAAAAALPSAPRCRTTAGTRRPSRR
jgi:hypothetical protein